MRHPSEPRIHAVQLKNELQAKLQADRDRFGDAECDRRRDEWLATSQDPLAVLWRNADAAQTRDKALP